MVVLTIIIIERLNNSAHRPGLDCAREDELAANSMGINTYQTENPGLCHPARSGPGLPASLYGQDELHHARGIQVLTSQP